MFHRSAQRWPTFCILRASLIQMSIVRVFRSRSLRDGSLSYKGRFATFVRSYWTLHVSIMFGNTIYTINMHDYPGYSLEASQSNFFEICFLLYTYEPFGLGRFATDHSLTKAASRPLFARVRRYAFTLCKQRQ